MKIEYKYPFIYFFFFSLPPYSLERSKSSEVESGSVVLEFQNRTSGLHKALNTKHKKAKSTIYSNMVFWFYGFWFFVSKKHPRGRKVKLKLEKTLIFYWGGDTQCSVLLIFERQREQQRTSPRKVIGMFQLLRASCRFFSQMQMRSTSKSKCNRSPES